MPSIIDRYLIREIGLTLLATTLVLLAIVMSHRLASYLSDVANGLLARDAIFALLGLQAIEILILLICKSLIFIKEFSVMHQSG